MKGFVLKRFLFSVIFLFMILFNFNISFAIGNTHYLKNDWYNENETGVKRSDIETITFKEEDDDFYEDEYEILWKLDNSGLMAYFTTDTDIVISIPEGDILKADKNASGLFSSFNKMTNIDNLSLLDTSIAEDMSYMFHNLKNVDYLDLSNFNTNKVTNMEHMFDGMNKLENINLTSFNTANVTNMSGMFSGLYNIKNINVKNFDTKNVKDINDMFKDNKKIEELDLSSFNTSNVREANRLFSGCKKLKTLKIENLNLINAENNVKFMFENCDKLSHIAFNGVKLPKKIDCLFSGLSTEGLNIYDIDTKNVTSMRNLFDSSFKLKSLNTQFNTENVEDMSYMFANCQNLEWLYVYKFDTKKVKSMNSMFYNCKSLKEIDLKDFNTENVEDMTSMFSKCKDLKKLDLSNFNTRKVKPNRLYEMLFCLSGLEELDISSNDFILNYVDESYTVKDDYYAEGEVDYYSYYNLSLGDLHSLKKIKINDEIANRAYDLRLIGEWRNVKTNTVSTIRKDSNILNRFTSGEYELIPSCKISFEPKSILKMYDMNWEKGHSLNTEADILQIDETNNVYYNEGIKFGGWYLDKDLKNRVPSDLKIDNDTTLYARVEIKKYKVIFNTNGGTEILSQFVDYNSPVNKPSIIPEKKNYKFIGWYKDKDFNELYDFSEKITGDTEIYAGYEYLYK